MKPYGTTDIETDLRAAIDAGNQAEIERLGALMDEAERQEKQRHQEPSLGGSALWYAQQGIAVFPLQAGRKAPRGRCPECKETGCNGPDNCGHDTCHGLRDATTDLNRVTAWWTRWPDANIGIATGDPFDAVDIDGHLGQRSRTEHWDDIFSAIDNDGVAKVLTPRPGGMHIYVPATGDGNSSGIVDGVDYRGDGGYVVAPPSVITPGGKDHPGRYRFLGTPNLDALRAKAV